MLGTNVGFVWPPHIQQCPTMPNNAGICWDKCWHRLARALHAKITIYYRTEQYKVLNSDRPSYATSATSDIKREQGLNYFIKYMLCLDTTMLRKLENENKNQNKKNLRLKIYGKIRNGRLKLEPSALIKKTCSC